MRYSVITSNCSNKLNFLRSYVRSLNAQIILPTEIIFINNRSNNLNIKQFLIRNLNTRIKLKYINFYYKKNVAHCYNLALKCASNSIILRLDIDDQWLSDHSKYLINEFKKDNKYLIYSSDYKTVNIKGYADVNLLVDNPTLHSSWLINLNICRRFKYIPFYPEDFATLSNYFRKGFKFKLLKKKTIIYNEHSGGLGSSKFANIDFKDIKKKNLRFYLFNKNYLNLIRDLGFFGILKLLSR
jgi:hypothetical protein